MHAPLDPDLPLSEALAEFRYRVILDWRTPLDQCIQPRTGSVLASGYRGREFTATKTFEAAKEALRYRPRQEIAKWEAKLAEIDALTDPLAPTDSEATPCNAQSQ